MPIDDAIRPWWAHDAAAPGDPATAAAQAERLRSLEQLGQAYVAAGPSAVSPPATDAAARIAALEEWTARVVG
jgi:hypothetical protein